MVILRTLLLWLILPLSVFATELPTPNEFGGDFSLPSTRGKVASLSEWKGEVVLLNFGFTSCPDVCPIVLSKLALVQNKLDKDADELQVVFVTVDPERDTLEKMKSYLKKFHPDFIGMRAGKEADVKAIMRRYGAVLEADLAGDGGEEISHSDYVYLINRQGYVAGFYDIKSSYKEVLEIVSKHL